MADDALAVSITIIYAFILHFKVKLLKYISN